MDGTQAIALMMIGLVLGGCTSDPNAPVNQATPIRQMDSFFRSMSAPHGASAQASSAGVPDYTHVPGYAPAYPPY